MRVHDTCASASLHVEIPRQAPFLPVESRCLGFVAAEKTGGCAAERWAQYVNIHKEPYGEYSLDAQILV
jgi:proteasome lid subunit RPN8/RPN11